ncbi:MAG: VanZ family protein [Firmicutes bacterium]|nr:VanZ family protein [Bacillota bacterium]
MTKDKIIKGIMIVTGILLMFLEFKIMNSMAMISSISIVLIITIVVGLTIHKLTSDAYNNLLITVFSSITYIMLTVYYGLFVPTAFMDYTNIIIFLINFFGLNLPVIVDEYLSSKISNFGGYLKYLCIYFSVSYMILLSDALFFNNRGGFYFKEINLVPFKTIVPYILNTANVNSNIVIINVLGNIILFIPIGVIVGIIVKKKIKSVLNLALIPMLIETIQYISATGVADIDDFILNFAGELMGLGIVGLVEKLYSKRHKDVGKRLFKLE